MTNQIINFTFEAQTIRTATNPQGEIYFCLPDVASVLEISRSSDLLQIQKDFVKNETLKNRGTLDPKGVEKIAIQTKGGVQEVTFINEPNLYRVIFRSNKAEARQFQNWVFNDVLPSIRKTGSYRHTISIEQQAQIRQAVARRCKSNREHYQSVYTALHQKFGIPRYDELLACDFDEALAFIMTYQLVPALNVAFIKNVLADSAYQNRKAQSEIQSLAVGIRHLLDHLGDLQSRINHQERCITALQNRF